MKRINENTIELTQGEIDSLAQFIEESLDAAWAAARDAAWDNYTHTYCRQAISWREGMKRMNPEMYKMMETIDNI